MGDLPPTPNRRAEAVLLAAILIATVGIHLPAILSPRLFYDDFVLFSHSWDGPTTLANLWRPHNEHAMPLGRIASWALLAADWRVETLPFRAALQGTLAAALAAGLIYLFVRRESGRAFPALVAAALYGVSTKYYECVTWYAASMWTLGLVTMLLALLAAQRFRRRGRRVDLAWTAMWCALAPGWYAGAVVGGPLCALYLWPGSLGWRGRGRAMVPLLGTALFLAVSLPMNAHQIMHAAHYGDRTALDAFDPLFGLACAGRATVDVLFVNRMGLGGDSCPPSRVPWVLLAAALALAWWDRRAPARVVLLALGVVVAHYVLTFSPRSEWSYPRQMVSWTRYHLVPWFGMVLLVVARWCGPAESGSLSRWQACGVGFLTAVLFVIHWQFTSALWEASTVTNAEQRATLGRLTDVERRCREHGIAAGDARAVLAKWDVPMSGDFDIRDWLRGGDGAATRSPDEVRRLLTE